MIFKNIVMTSAEKAIIEEAIQKITELEKGVTGISVGIDELQSYLLLVVGSAIVVPELDESRFEEIRQCD